MPRTIYFNPNASGLEIFLGPMEARLMELAWKHGELTVKKALSYLASEAEEEHSKRPRVEGPVEPGASSPKSDPASDSRPAYTTVMTVLSRLAEKGVLVRQRTGRNFVYRPAMNREQYLEERTRLVMQALENSLKHRICF